MPSPLFPVEGMISELAAPKTDVFFCEGLSPICMGRAGRQIFATELVTD
jgi:hypothetical protein